MQQNLVWVMRKKHIFIFGLFFICFYLYAQVPEAEFIEADNLPKHTKFQIGTVKYDMKGLTREEALKRAVSIDTETQFTSLIFFYAYLKKLETEFKNIRTLETVRLEPLYAKPNAQNLCMVTLIIHTKDTFNFIALPYPKYDSNSGFSLKVKAKDNNFIGTMRPFNFDFSFQGGNPKSISANCDFVYPYEAGPFFASQAFESEFDLNIDGPQNATFKLGTTSAFLYRYKFLTVIFGLTQSFNIDTNYGAKIGNKGYTYYFQTKPFVSLPITIAHFKNFGSLVYTPRFLLKKNWSFSKEANDTMKSVSIEAGHSLVFGKVSWKHNFREGLDFKISNDYSYNIYWKGKSRISISTTVKGFLSFFNRFGIYSRMNFFYNFNNTQTDSAGKMLRGILDRRLSTDMALSCNIDIPIKILSTELVATTDRNWTRFFDFELQFVPFLDFAFVHDMATKRYFSPKDAWCSGGLEVIVFPAKFRSISVRASLGFDLKELKNVPGLNKLKGTAKRDGNRISEIFIGIGLHY